MPKFAKPFIGVKDQDIYPSEFEAGDECPPELELAAKEAGVLMEGGKKSAAKEAQTTPPAGTEESTDAAGQS
ncbi:hypothetical protein ACUXVY_22055 [Chromobacterium haemolyticum]|uniref:hypothetical protein n=1 Tax=Chromobacterium haemolyticum TaxID=394935 RepID=UPI00405722BB